MTRRAFLTIAAAGLPLRADAASETLDVIAAMAAALAEANPQGFLKPIDLKMLGYDTLARDVEGMLLQAEAHSSVVPISNEGDDFARTIVATWELRLKRRGGVRLDVRRQVVTLKFARQDKRWMIVELDPISLFAPPDFR
jgi:hypothetical protein